MGSWHLGLASDSPCDFEKALASYLYLGLIAPTLGLLGETMCYESLQYRKTQTHYLLPERKLALKDQ